MFRRKRSLKTIIEGLLIAGSLGALATFVFGTKKGRKLQHQVVNKCKKLGRKAAPSMKKLKKISKKAIKAAPASLKKLQKISKIVEMKKHKVKHRKHKKMKRAA